MSHLIASSCHEETQQSEQTVSSSLFSSFASPIVPSPHLPEEARLFLERWYQQGTTDEVVQAIVYIANTIQEHPLLTRPASAGSESHPGYTVSQGQGQEQETDLAALRTSLSQWAVGCMKAVSQQIMQYEMLLGYLLILIQEASLYTPLGYHDLREICENNGIEDTHLIERALKCYTLWTYLKPLGYDDPIVVVNGELSGKETMLLRKLQHKERTLRLLEQQAISDLKGQRVPESEVGKQIQRLPSPQRQALQERVREQYVASTVALVEHYRETSKGHLIQEEKKQQGKGDRPCLYLTGYRDTSGTFVITEGSFDASYLVLQGMHLNPTACKLLIRERADQSYLPAEEWADRMLDQIIPPQDESLWD